MPRPRPASRLHQLPERWIFDVLKVNNQPRRRIRTPEIMKRISFPRILLLMHHHMGLNPLQHSPRRNKIVVPAEKNLDNKAKARILLPLTSTLPLSRRTKTRIRTRKTYLILSATPVSRGVIMPKGIPKKSQKTSVGLDNLHVGD